jgi:hypothetical protein
VAVVSRTASYVIGVDLGRNQDHTAVAVVESVDLVHDLRDPYTYEPRRESVVALRHIERIRLGVPYPDVVRLIKDLVSTPVLAANCTLVLDATGVGTPVVDLLKRERMSCRLIPVTITAGDRETSAASAHRVPKRDLIAGLQVLFESTYFHVARGLRDSAAFFDELAAMRATVTSTGHDRYEGKKDDLVLALALAWWWAGKRVPKVWGTRPLL